MPTLTPNYSFNLPLVNNATDADLWGGFLNANWTSLDTLLNNIIPAVGDIEFNTTGTNPSTKYSGTTWVRVAEGRFIVGEGEGTDADSATRTYPQGNDSVGTYEHTLTEAELPAAPVELYSCNDFGVSTASETMSLDPINSGRVACHKIRVKRCRLC